MHNDTTSKSIESIFCAESTTDVLWKWLVAVIISKFTTIVNHSNNLYKPMHRYTITKWIDSIYCMESTKNVLLMTTCYHTLQIDNNCYIFKQCLWTDAQSYYFTMNRFNFCCNKLKKVLLITLWNDTET